MLTLLALVVDTLHAHFDSTGADPRHTGSALIWFWPNVSHDGRRVVGWTGVRACDVAVVDA